MINPCLLAQQSHVIIAGANESAKCQPVGIGGGIKPVIGLLHTCEIGKQTVSSTTFHDIKFVVCAIDGGTSPSLHLLLKSRPILLIETPYLWRDITVVEGLLYCTRGLRWHKDAPCRTHRSYAWIQSPPRCCQYWGRLDSTRWHASRCLAQ